MTIESDNANFLWKRKFEQRIPFPRKGKPKSKHYLIQENKNDN